MEILIRGTKLEITDSMKDYVKADGTRGDYLEKFAQVFRREGQECPRCGGEILKTRTAGRGTHYCGWCQK